MADELTFMMGKFPARILTDRMYVGNHMWCVTGGPRYRFGFTAYALRLLQDVYFLEWIVDAPTPIRFRQEIGSIESSKAESALYAPMAGNITQFNEALLDDPSEINLDNYGKGWLFEMEGSAEDLLTAAGYVQYLDDVWKETQRTLKGQFNE